jgi:Zn-finger nucleic acid-binding protein
MIRTWRNTPLQQSTRIRNLAQNQEIEVMNQVQISLSISNLSIHKHQYAKKKKKIEFLHDIYAYVGVEI